MYFPENDFKIPDVTNNRNIVNNTTRACAEPILGSASSLPQDGVVALLSDLLHEADVQRAAIDQEAAALGKVRISESSERRSYAQSMRVSRVDGGFGGQPSQSVGRAQRRSMRTSRRSEGRRTAWSGPRSSLSI